MIQLKGSIIFLEVDENQHRFGEYFVACDMKRMSHVMQALAIEGNTLPIVFVRYNPPGFKVDGTTRRTFRKDREARLLRWLSDHESNTSKPLQIVYMYYDTLVDDGNMAEVTLNPDYHTQMRECVTDVLIDV